MINATNVKVDNRLEQLLYEDLVSSVLISFSDS